MLRTGAVSSSVCRLHLDQGVGFNDQNGAFLYVYDSTNGTMSRGYIIDTNKGWADGAMCDNK